MIALASHAAAQEAGTDGRRAPSPAQGEMVVQRVLNGPVFGTDVKFASVGGDWALYFGSSGGFVFDGRLLLGGGFFMRLDRGYPEKETVCGWQSSGLSSIGRGCWEYEYSAPGDFYGGLLAGWRVVGGGRFSLIARGLVGGGEAKIGWDGSERVVNPAVNGPEGEVPVEALRLYDQPYFVFEPQVDASFIVGSHVVIGGGVGYRVIGHANGLEDRLKGLTAFASVRFF
jgi:hypothetical protein